MPNRIIELHDFEVEAVLRTKGGRVSLIFSSAYIHESEGIPGRDRGRGLAQRAELEVEDGEIVTNLPSWPSTISDGFIRINGELRENVIPIPFDFTGAFEIELMLVSWKSLYLKGKRAKLSLQGEATYEEDFPGPQ